MIYNPETKQFESIAQLRRAFPNTTIPRNPDAEQLAAFNRVFVEPTEPPEGDVVTQGEPVQGEDGGWHQTWNVRGFTPEEISQQLSALKLERINEIDRMRDQAFEAGLPYDINDQPDIVQTRLQDKINLLGLRIEAQELNAAGVTDPVMPFRAESNTGYQLTPQQMIDLTNAALAHIQAIYQQSWQLKDAIKKAKTQDELVVIKWP